MKRLGPTAGGALALIRRDFQLALSYRFQLVAGTLGGLFTLTIFYYVSRLVRVGPFDSPDEYYAFVIVGILILQVLNSVLAGPPNILRQELVAGTFERLAVSPFGPVGAVASMMLFPFVLAIVTASILLVFGVTIFGVNLQLSTAALAVPAAIFGGLAFAPFGALLVALVLVVKQAAMGTTWVIALISLVAGIYFPVALLPGWIAWAAEVQPFTPAVDLLRHFLIGIPLRESAWLTIAKIAGFSALFLPLSLRVLAAAVRLGQRRGTITEY